MARSVSDVAIQKTNIALAGRDHIPFAATNGQVESQVKKLMGQHNFDEDSARNIIKWAKEAKMSVEEYLVSIFA